MRIGRTHLYTLIERGKIRPVKHDTRTLIPYRDIQLFINALVGD